MTPPNLHQYDRRRAEDVFRAVENEVFLRLDAISDEVGELRQGVSRLSVEGCAHRAGDLQRTQHVEASITRLFDKVDNFGDTLARARVDLVSEVGVIKTDISKQVGGIKAWVLTGVVIVLFAVAAFFLGNHFMGIGK